MHSSFLLHDISWYEGKCIDKNGEILVFCVHNEDMPFMYAF